MQYFFKYTSNGYFEIKVSPFAFTILLLEGWLEWYWYLHGQWWNAWIWCYNFKNQLLIWSNVWISLFNFFFPSSLVVRIYFLKWISRVFEVWIPVPTYNNALCGLHILFFIPNWDYIDWIVFNKVSCN